jgi:hypothetical protein
MAQGSADTRRFGDVLVHGLPGHPLHPPLTDATIGMFVLAPAWRSSTRRVRSETRPGRRAGWR